MLAKACNNTVSDSGIIINHFRRYFFQYNDRGNIDPYYRINIVRCLYQRRVLSLTVPHRTYRFDKNIQRPKYRLKKISMRMMVFRKTRSHIQLLIALEYNADARETKTNSN